MDDHLIIITVEYHAMAEDVPDAIRRALANINHEARDLYPHRIEVKAEPR